MKLLIVVSLLTVLPALAFAGLRCSVCSNLNNDTPCEGVEKTKCEADKHFCVTAISVTLATESKNASSKFIRECARKEGNQKGCSIVTTEGERVTQYLCEGDMCNEKKEVVPCTPGRRTSGSGRPKLTSLASWVVATGCLSLAYL